MDSTKKSLKKRLKELALKIEKDPSFSVLEGFLGEGLLQCVKEMNFSRMTEVQARSIPPLLAGRDLLGAAKTGSGKTLAFLIPAVHLITKLEFTPRNGVGAVIITPTRELALQILKVLKALTKGSEVSVGVVMGGVDRGGEVRMLKGGVNILVATPGRLLDHLKSEEVMVKNMKLLVMDEADRILKEGFEQTLKQIIHLLPHKRQTVLFSATMTSSTDDLARLSLKDAARVDVVEGSATVGGLDQGYLICPSDKRLHILFTYLYKHRHQKLMVFLSSCLAVDYLQELCHCAKLPTLSIHGKQPQSIRTATFATFTEAQQATLLCTDVAARGLDFPHVDVVIQYDPPDDPNEYIHRVGRTARGEQKGSGVLFLRAEEGSFIEYLSGARVPIKQLKANWNKVSNIQQQLEAMVRGSYRLKNLAREAYKAHVRAYASRSSLRNIFDVFTLNLPHVACSFGLLEAPFVELNIGGLKNSQKRKQRADFKQSCNVKRKKIYQPLNKK